jgi:hypothetical protein
MALLFKSKHALVFILYKHKNKDKSLFTTYYSRDPTTSCQRDRRVPCVESLFSFSIHTGSLLISAIKSNITAFLPIFESVEERNIHKTQYFFQWTVSFIYTII